MLRPILLVVAGLVALALFRPASAQKLDPAVFAIRDARVIAEPGKVLAKATVVIRDGLVEAVGPEVRVPADAVVIDGKGLTVYPGFLDALSNWGFDNSLRRSEGGAPGVVELNAEALATTRPDNRKGLTPEFEVRSALKEDETAARGWRGAGFTAHLIAPDGGFVVGQSALVSLSGAPPREAVLRSPVAQHLAFRPVGGTDYPRVLMGIVSHCRQTFLDSAYHARQRKAFDEGKLRRRPPADAALEALQKSATGPKQLPVVFEADTGDQIDRALAFAREFSLKPILFGGRDAWKRSRELKKAGVPVLLRIDFEEERPDEKELPARVRADRQKKAEAEAACAALLHKEGVRFAFATQGHSGDRPWEKFRSNLRKVIAAGLPPEAALAALTTSPAQILGVERLLGTVAPGKVAHLTIMSGDLHLPTSQVRHVFVDGKRFDIESSPSPKKPPAKKEKKPKAGPPPDYASELDEDRRPKLKTGGNVLLKGANVLPVSGPMQPATDILVRNGKIAAIGKDLRVPKGTMVIDVTGMFVMPGIVDTHCHFAASGGVNEFSLSVVPEVRIQDVLNSEDVQIYRALAGGVTTARILHGSANVIGGQDAVLKMKYGLPANLLLVVGGPRGIKFALGENVKRTDGRFPNTRLGVEAVLVRAFTEAREYRRRWQQYQKERSAGKSPPEPRRDLRLEALADVLSGELRVHCHCYRADEILMLLRVAERFGVRIASLQHVLEGYKVGPEIARHGASCSPFSDWWAYKWEAGDAIPFNAALLLEAGASVCLKSDSNELMRHLYQEAAKLIKYGGMTELQALATITLNPAKQLGLEKRIGTIEVGKDADLAVFNGHPLNSYSRVELTLIEGEVFFQRGDTFRPFAPAVAGPARSTPLDKPLPRNATGRYLIYGATVHPVDGAARQNHTVEIHKGRITALRPTSPRDREVAGSIDATGLHLYPGMIDAGTVLGLTEVDSARETRDFAESGDFQPDLRASTAINPDSELIPVTRANGVLTVVTRPTGGIVAGQSALINLAGWVPREMTLRDPLALHLNLPGGLAGIGRRPDLRRINLALTKKTRELRMRRLRDLFRQALVHDEARKASPARPADPRLEALIPYARGSKPVVIQANRRREILDALKLADELKLKVIVSGGLDAWKVTGELKKRDVPVILGPVMALPAEKHDPYDAAFRCAAKLHEAGVRFCIRSEGGSNTRNLPYEAAMAVSYGLPPAEGLKAVTLYPAQILGVADELGSIGNGKRANLVLTNGDLLQPSVQVVGLFIDGKPLPPTSKHTRLYERYRERLREVREGKAPLGTR